MAEEVVENPYLAILGEDEVRLAMYIFHIVDDNASSPLNIPEGKNQGEAMYNSDWGHDGISGSV